MSWRTALSLLCLFITAALTSCASHITITPPVSGLDRIAATWNLTPAPWSSTAPPLTVVYPREAGPDTLLAPGDSVITGSLPPDSLFLFGHVADPAGELTVNGISVPIHPGGGWLAWVPRGPVRTLAEDDPLGAGRLAVVTIQYSNPSHTQTPYLRRILFLDKTSGTARSTSGFIADTTRLLVIDPHARIRCGWPGTYIMFPAEDTELFAIGRTTDDPSFWRLPLGGGQTGWIEDSYVQPLDRYTPLPPEVIGPVTARVDGRETSVSIPLRNKKPFRVVQVADDRLELTIYGAVSWTDLIIQPFGSRVVDEFRWSQTDSTTWKLTAFLHSAWFQGWTVAFDAANDLVWTIHQAPEIGDEALRGLRIVLDPGHGGTEYSAIGPTGLPEKTANLRLARALTQELEAAGAEVIATRTADSSFALLDRVDFVNAAKPDLCLSLHHNALAQGVNPFGHHGASVHYNHRHAHPLAAALYKAILAGGWPGDGLRYQDLALARISRCPSVLIEAAYLMHPDEEAVLRTDGYYQDLAHWLRAGLESYLGDVRRAQHAGTQDGF